MNKKGELYKSMNRGRMKLVVYGALFLCIAIILTTSYMPYIKTFFVGATELNTKMFLGESEDFILTSEYTADNADYDYYINDFTTKDASYWQGDRYKFTLTPTLKQEKVLVYSEDVDIGNEVKSFESLCVHMIESSGRNILVLAKPNVDLKSAAKIEGLITKPAKAILADLAKQIEAEEELVINEYIIDTRGIEMGMENTVLTSILICIIAGLFMIAKGVVYFIKPKLAPTYSQLKKYGDIDDIANDIEQQLLADNVVYEKHKIYTEDWILTESSFKKKVEKNPAKGHQFKYTPKV